MSYLPNDDPQLRSDINSRKEFRWLHKKHIEPSFKDLGSRYDIDNEISRSDKLQLTSYQLFVQNYINPNTTYKTLFMQWYTGSGKTIGSISIAMNFIKKFKSMANPGSVFILGFSKHVFKNELLRNPEFGFMTKEEYINIKRIKNISPEKYQEAVAIIKKRFSNRKFNGFFRFFGYKAFANQLFISQNGETKLNEELLWEFENSLVICDEIHNVYNSTEKNNWGNAIQILLSKVKTLRAIIMTATPLNNSPTEIVDLLNLLNPDKIILKKEDLFNEDLTLKKTAHKTIHDLAAGKISFVRDINPEFYPSFKILGDAIAGIPYLKFIRCKMSPLQEKTFNLMYKGKMAIEDQYINDFALPNPDEDIGMYQPHQIKTKIIKADQAWRDRIGLNYVNNRIIGTAFHIDSLHKYSGKYAKMVEDLIWCIKNKRGKIFIYHNIVHNSGVMLIEEILSQNGFISEYGNEHSNTLCFGCGYPKNSHNCKEFIPIRFAIVHSEIDKKQMEITIDKFNAKINATGEHILILIGSKIIKESYDLKCIRNIFIMSRPDNISTLIQIRGRAIRKNSHKELPPDERNVDMRIYTCYLQTKLGGADDKEYASNNTIIVPTTGEDIVEFESEESESDDLFLFSDSDSELKEEQDSELKEEQEYSIIDSENQPEDSELKEEQEYSIIDSDSKEEQDSDSDSKEKIEGGQEKYMSYEELKYKEKVKSFQTIQEIEMILHESAIDSWVNKEMIEKSTNDPLDIFPFKIQDYSKSTVKTVTFNAFHKESEIILVKLLIKRLFVEISPFWHYNDLVAAVKSASNFEHEYNVNEISESTIKLALSLLIWRKDTYTWPSSSDTASFIDKLFDSNSKLIPIPGVNGSWVIVKKDQYYLLAEFNGTPIINFDSIWRIRDVSNDSKISMNDFVNTKQVNFDYKEKKKVFFKKYSDSEIENMGNVICEYGKSFHKKFIEECIEYVFNCLTSTSVVKNEMHEFYFKMLAYYDMMSLILYAHMAKASLDAKYSQYIVKVKPSDLVVDKEIDKIQSSDDLATSNVINVLKEMLSHSNVWLPQIMREKYTHDLKIAQDKKRGKIPANRLPIAHFMGDFIVIYDPKNGWYEDPNYREKIAYVENDIIIGYDAMVSTGTYIRFKLRKPIQAIQKHNDARLIETGTVCKSKGKDYLTQLAKKLKIEIPEKFNIESICSLIRTRLIRLELIERMKNTNLKYFYYHWEIPKD